MNMQEFDKVNLERCESPTGFNQKLNSWSLSDWLLATMGELGEAANVAKKLNRVRDNIPGNDKTEEELRKHLAYELADTYIYLSLACQAAGISLAEIIPEVFNKKSEKIGYAVRI